MFGIPISDTWLMVLVIVIIAIVAMKRIIVSFSLVMGFSYPNARYSAMGNEYVTRSGLQKVRDARNLEEAISTVSSRDYEFPKDAAADIDSAVNALSDIESKFTRTIMEEIPKKAHPFFNAVLYRTELEELREAFIERFESSGVAASISSVSGTSTRRAENEDGQGNKQKRDGSEKEEEENTGNETIREIIGRSDSPVEAAELLARSGHKGKYGFLIKDEFQTALSSIEDQNDFSQFDILLDKEYFRNLKETGEKVTPFLQASTFELLKLHSDIFNIRTAVRGVAAEMPVDSIMARFVPPGGEIPQWKLELLAESSDVHELMEELKGTPFYPSDKDLFSGKDSYVTGRESGEGNDDIEISPVIMDIALDRILLEKTIELAQQHPLTTGSTLRFMESKRFEMRNLNIIFRSLAAGIPGSEYEDLLVLEEGAA